MFPYPLRRILRPGVTHASSAPPPFQLHPFLLTQVLEHLARWTLISKFWTQRNGHLPLCKSCHLVNWSLHFNLSQWITPPGVTTSLGRNYWTHMCPPPKNVLSLHEDKLKVEAAGSVGSFKGLDSKKITSYVTPLSVPASQGIKSATSFWTQPQSLVQRSSPDSPTFQSGLGPSMVRKDMRWRVRSTENSADGAARLGMDNVKAESMTSTSQTWV